MSEKVASLDCIDKIVSHLEENIPDLNKITPILKQIEESDCNIIDHVNSFDSKKVSKIHIATILGDCQLVQDLIRNGSDVNSQTKRKITPLHLAVFFKRNEIVRLLLENGANSNIISDLYFGSPFHMAASECGNLEAIKMMLKFEADLNSKNIHGSSALWSAILYRNVEIAKLLLKSGIQVNCDNSVKTYLYLAATMDNYEIIPDLLYHGADLNRATLYFKETPLHVAAKACSLKAMNILMKNGASLTLKNESGKVPLECCFKPHGPYPIQLPIDPVTRMKFALKSLKTFVHNIHQHDL